MTAVYQGMDLRYMEAQCYVKNCFLSSLVFVVQQLLPKLARPQCFFSMAHPEKNVIPSMGDKIDAVVLTISSSMVLEFVNQQV